MTAYQLESGMPALPLFPGMQVKLEAISPTTGLAITGVKVTAFAIQAVNTGGGSGVGVNVTVGPFMFVPGPSA